MKWFKHDSDASFDAKLRKLKIKYGMEGYGLYWHCLECIARGVDTHNLTFELEEDSEVIALDTHLSRELVEDMMRYMLELGLFEEGRGRITCLKMATRTDEYTQKVLRSTNNDRTLSGHEPDNIRLIRREKNRKDKSKGRFTPPTVEEVKKYCEERGNSVDPVKFVNHYESIGWMRGKNKIKNWKSCVITWERREDKPKKNQSEEWLV